MTDSPWPPPARRDNDGLNSLLQRRTSLRRTQAGLYLAYTGLGVTGAVVPAAMPALAQALSVEPRILLPAVSALFAGLFVGVALAPIATALVGAHRCAGGGAAVQAVCLFSIGMADGSTGVVTAAFAAGIGFGAVESSGAVVSRQLATSRSRALTGLTAATAAAAASTPLAIVAVDASSVRYVLHAAAAPHVLAALILFLRTAPAPPPGGPGDFAHWVRDGNTMALAVFCYVGCETVIAGWSAALPQVVFTLDAPTAAAGTSVFWALLMLGRMTAHALLARGTPARTVLTTSQISSALSLLSAALLSQHHPPLSMATIGLAVVCMGPCYALLLGIAVDAATDQAAASIAAKLVALGALGGASWAAAVASTASVEIVTVATAAALGMVGSVLLLRRQPR